MTAFMTVVLVAIVAAVILVLVGTRTRHPEQTAVHEPRLGSDRDGEGPARPA